MDTLRFKLYVSEAVREALASEGMRVCAWCKKDLGQSDEFQGTSHGICQDCKDKMMADLAKQAPQTNPTPSPVSPRPPGVA